MHSTDLLNNFKKDLDNMQDTLTQLASYSEFQGKRDLYFRIKQDLELIQQQIEDELNNINKVEKYTSTLDTI
ncbi:hypothetical protein SYNTR_0849 [Candidatus Syntrophocurvum alkaliphilum]|uniref:Uncharacterized protein n=1 Tax=Candidatus Syntrophocurvum alkaliphilum TaxID=2293317 RepID=A0A6I6DEJ7_9FIRM|nr:hypothetical protein [Candidatus Syntrophocurvum alkaliphilum]QGT99442.1 hypothetical protein SYNTR_0849 [Candidatus Syntrophocurvum alkaliphilum]